MNGAKWRMFRIKKGNAEQGWINCMFVSPIQPAILERPQQCLRKTRGYEDARARGDRVGEEGGSGWWRCAFTYCNKMNGNCCRFGTLGKRRRRRWISAGEDVFCTECEFHLLATASPEAYPIMRLCHFTIATVCPFKGIIALCPY